MSQKSGTTGSPSERLVKIIRRATRRHHSAEEKIRIVLDGLRGEASIAELCRREGIAEGLYYSWSKEFLEAGKRRLAGDTARAATSSEVTELRPATPGRPALTTRAWGGARASAVRDAPCWSAIASAPLRAPAASRSKRPPRLSAEGL